MAFLKPDKVRVEHGLEIKEKIIPWGAVWKKNYGGFKKGDLYKADRKLSNGTGKVQYITIHNTEDIQEAPGTNDAEQYTRATYPNQNMGDARVHYFIDETDCWQNLREDEIGWHAGDGRGPGNETSLAIEIIMGGTGSRADIEAEERGALLAAILLNKHKLGIDKMVPHKKWSGKLCPVYILPHWDEFVAKVEKYLDQIQGKVEPVAPNKNVIEEGDLVSISADATYYDGKKMPSWVKAKRWIVKEANEDRVVIDKSEDGKNSINSAVNAKYLTVVSKQFDPYIIKITAQGGLNIRKGPGLNNPIVKTLRGKELTGAYTIVDEEKGSGATKGWGLLKAYSKNRNGWISLDWVKKV